MKRFLSILKYAAFLAVGVLLFWLAFRSQDEQKIFAAFRHADYSFVVLSVGFMLLSDLSRAIRWTMLIKPLGYEVSTRHSFMAIMIGYLANLAFPRMGEFAKCMVLKRTDKVPIDRLMGTVVVERIIDIFILAGLVGLTLLLEFNDLSHFYWDVLRPSLVSVLKPYLDVELAILLFVLLAGGIATFVIMHRRYGMEGVVNKLQGLMRGFVSGLKTIRSLDQPWLFWTHTAFIWFMYWAMTYVVFFSLDATSLLDPAAGLAVFVIGSLGFIMPVQGGIGTYHWAVTEGLQIYGVDPTYGFTYATLVHGSQFIAVIIVGGISFLGYTWLRRGHPNGS